MLFTAPEFEESSEEQLRNKLGEPRTGILKRLDGRKLEEYMPPHLVGPARALQGSDEEVRIIDFGSGTISCMEFSTGSNFDQHSS